MGGDLAPRAPIAGALQALGALPTQHHIELVGQTSVIEAELDALLRDDFAPLARVRDRISIVEAPEVITMTEAIARHPHDAANPDHTFYFHLDDGRVIDALHGGNASKWINHSCRPNCVPDEVRGRIFIMTRRPVFKGEELTFDYGLESDEPMSEALKARYACRCGAKKCRGTMLAT